MKIALVILHADPTRGGAERYTVDLAAGLSKRGHNVSLLASSFAAGQANTVHLPTRGATRLGRYLEFLDSLDAHVKDVSYDVVHAMLPVRTCDVYHPHAGIAAETIGAGRPMQRLANRFNRKRQRFTVVEREMLERAPGPIMLCLSDYVKGTARRHYPQLAESRLVKLFNGIDLRKFDPDLRPSAGAELRQRLGILPEKIVALMLAQDFARKGLKETIGVMTQVADQRLMLLVAGKDDPSAYQRMTGSDRVIFAGATDDPYSFYRAADFFVLPTRHDPCSLVVLEALAMGVPVISTVFNGACEIMAGGRGGVVLDDPGDLPTLAAAMISMLDPNRRKQWRAQCLALRPALSQETHLDELERVYQKAAVKTPA